MASESVSGIRILGNIHSSTSIIKAPDCTPMNTVTYSVDRMENLQSHRYSTQKEARVLFP